MSDAYVIQKGSKLPNGTEQIDIPVKFTDNGDGTYSNSGINGATVAASQAGVWTFSNTSFSINGSLPAFASTPTFNLGTLNGAATNAGITGISSKTLTDLSNLQTITPTTNQVVAIGTNGTTRSNAVGSTTTRVVLTATSDCWVQFGTSGALPTAAAHVNGSGSFLKAGVPSYPMTVTPSSTVIAVIQDSAAGYLSILESV